MTAANLLVRFLLEVGLLVALGAWAWGRGGAVAGIAVPALTMVVWATVVHGASVPGPVRFGVQVVVFAAAIATLADRPALASALAAVSVVNALLLPAPAA